MSELKDITKLLNLQNWEVLVFFAYYPSPGLQPEIPRFAMKIPHFCKTCC